MFASSKSMQPIYSAGRPACRWAARWNLAVSDLFQRNSGMTNGTCKMMAAHELGDNSWVETEIARQLEQIMLDNESELETDGEDLTQVCYSVEPHLPLPR